MDSSIIVALITVAGGLIGALISAGAAIRAANIQKGKGDLDRTDRAGWFSRVFPTRLRGTVLWGAVIAAFFAGAVALSLMDYLGQRVRAQIMGDLNALRLVASRSVSDLNDQADVRPWQSVQGSKIPQLLLSATAGSRGEDGSLRLQTNLRPWQSDTSDFAGVQLSGTSLPEAQVSLAIVWVYIPKSESGGDGRVHGHIIAYSQNTSGSFLTTYGTDAEIVRGQWTPLVWGGTYNVELPRSSVTADSIRDVFTYKSQSNRLTELAITFWSEDGSYTGPIYVDDLRLYGPR